MDSQALESYLSEEELLDEEDEADMSLLPQNVQLLLHVTFNHLFHKCAIYAVRQTFSNSFTCLVQISEH